MKTILNITLSLFALTIFAQDKIYTKGLPNGYAWTAPSLVSSPIYAKDESLLASLAQRNYLSNIDSSINKNSFPLDCDPDINKLLKENKSIDFKEIVKLIDKFYTIKENLIIPVLGAYCYCIKELAGYKEVDLISYRKKLIEFSNSDLKQ